MPKRTENLLVPIQGVVPGDGKTLTITWEDGYRASLDLAGTIRAYAAYAPLDDDARFRSVAVAEDRWGVDFGQDLEMTTDMLRRMALEQAGELMPVEAFRHWRAVHRLSMAAAARELGISPRSVNYYHAGKRPIPKTIRLACLGYDASLRGTGGLRPPS